MSGSRAEGGQALVVVALAFGVLLGVLSLAADWGHGLAMRRVSQNEADAGALAAGKLLAASFGPSGFSVTQDDVWSYAACSASQNRGFGATSQVERVGVAFGRVALPDPTVIWTAPLTRELTTPPPCPARPTRGGIAVPADARYVEVRAETTFVTLFGAVTRRETSAGASARARLSASAILGAVPIVAVAPGDSRVPGEGLSGAPGQPRAPIWPVVRQFDPTDYDEPCGQYCDPNARDAQRITFWRNGDLPSGKERKIFGGFIGLVDPSHMSLRQAGVHQLTTDSDYTGSAHQPVPTSPLLDRSALCPLTTWDSNGSGSQADSLSCNITNWAYYGFRGGIGLGTDWDSPSWDLYRGAAAKPSLLSATRASCSSRSFFPAPSCTGSPSMRGDWVETFRSLPTDPELDDLTARMRAFIAREGQTLPWSTDVVARGPNRGNTYGKAALVYIFLFDCAESFASSTWTLIVPGGVPGGDCSVIDSTAPPLDRVHLFTVVPFLFYEGLVTSLAFEAYWGDAFGEPGTCRADGTGCRDLDPLKNTAFLVLAP